MQPKASVLSDSTFGDPLRALIPDPFLLCLWPSQQALGRPPILGRPWQLLGDVGFKVVEGLAHGSDCMEFPPFYPY